MPAIANEESLASIRTKLNTAIAIVDKLGSETTGEGAALIGFEDPDSAFDATTVQGALLELLATLVGKVDALLSITQEAAVVPESIYSRKVVIGGTGNTSLVGVGGGNLLEWWRTGDLSGAGHLVATISRCDVLVDASINTCYVVEARGGAVAAGASIGNLVWYTALSGTDSEDAGTVALATGYHFPNLSDGQYTQIQNAIAFNNEDPNAPIMSLGAILTPYFAETDWTGTYGEAGPPMVAGPPAGGWACCKGALQFTSTLTVQANTVYVTMVEVEARRPCTGIGLDIVTGSGNARFSIYKNEKGGPAGLLHDAGVVDVSTTGTAVADISSLNLSPGIYHLAVIFSGTPEIRMATSYTLPGNAGHTDLTGTPRGVMYSTAMTYGVSFPATFPTLIAGGGIEVPHLGIRLG